MNGWIARHSLIRRAVSVTALITFTVCYVLADARAAVGDPSGRQFVPLSVHTFTLPGHLGEVRGTFQGGKDRFVVHIQDAHCNPHAQHRIADIIDYLSKEYGLRTVNLEGGAGDYDLDVFTAITGDEIRREVADYFVKKGEINGAEFYAINNPDKVTLWGVEDKDLYMANLKVYRDSLSYRNMVEGHLKKLTYIYNNLKRHIYTPELLEMDMAYNAYKAGNMDFREYVEFVTAKAAERGVSLEEFPNIQLLAGSLSMEDSIDFKKANTERNILIEELKKTFSANETRELVNRTVGFKTKRISPREFYGYLLAKAEEVGVDIGSFPALAGYVVYVARYEEVDSSLLPAELDGIDAAVKETLYGNDAQRRLSVLSRNLALMKNIFAIRLIKTDYEYYLANKASFDAANFTSFIEAEAPKYGIKARPDAGIEELDTYLGEITEFYEYSFRRDEAFLQNLRFDSPSGGGECAVLMTGGFHAENLWALMKAGDISYVSILPKFTSGIDQESPYFSLLAGQMTDVQRMLRSALSVQAAMMQVASMLSSEMARSVWEEDGIKAFYSEVRLREILANGIRESGRQGCTVTVRDKGKEMLSVAEGDSPDSNHIDVDIAQILEWAQDIYIDTQVRDIMEGREGSYEVLDKSHAAVNKAIGFFETAIRELKNIGHGEFIAAAGHLENILGMLRDMADPARRVTSASGERVQLVLLKGARGFRGHAGGRGIYLNADAARSDAELAGILVHEAVAAYSHSHKAAQDVEDLFHLPRLRGIPPGQRLPVADITGIAREGVMREQPVWEVAKADRWKGGRDVAAGDADSVSLIGTPAGKKVLAPDEAGRNFYVTTGMITREKLNERVDLVRNSDFLEKLKAFLREKIKDRYEHLRVLDDIDIIFDGEQTSENDTRPVIKSVIVYGGFLYWHEEQYDSDLDVEVIIDWGPGLLGDIMRHQHDIERYGSINFHNADAMKEFSLASGRGKRRASEGADITINTGSVAEGEDEHPAQMAGVGIPIFGEDSYAPSTSMPKVGSPALAERNKRLITLYRGLMERGWIFIQRAKEASDDIEDLNKQIKRGYADQETFYEIAELEAKKKTSIRRAFKRYLESVVVMSFIGGFRVERKLQPQVRKYLQSAQRYDSNKEVDDRLLDSMKGTAEMLRKEVEVVARTREYKIVPGGKDSAADGEKGAHQKLEAVASWFDDPLWVRDAWKKETIWSYAPLAALLFESMFLAPVLQAIVPFAAAAVPAAIFLGLHIDSTLSFKEHVKPRSVIALTAVKLAAGGISAALSLINIPLAVGALGAMAAGTAFLHRYLNSYGEQDLGLARTADEISPVPSKKPSVRSLGEVTPGVEHISVRDDEGYEWVEKRITGEISAGMRFTMASGLLGRKQTGYTVVSGDEGGGTFVVRSDDGRERSMKRYSIEEAVARSKGLTVLHATTSAASLEKILESGNIIASRAATKLFDRKIGRLTSTDQTTSRSVTPLDRMIMARHGSYFRLWGSTKRPARMSYLEREFMGASGTREVTIVFDEDTADLKRPAPWKRFLFQPSVRYVPNKPKKSVAAIREIIVHDGEAYERLKYNSIIRENGIKLSIERPGKELKVFGGGIIPAALYAIWSTLPFTTAFVLIILEDVVGVNIPWSLAALAFLVPTFLVITALDLPSIMAYFRAERLAVSDGLLEEKDDAGSGRPGAVSDDPLNIETVTADAADGGEIEIVLDGGGVIEDIVRFGDKHGMRVQFAAGMARRMIMGKNPVLRGADIDLAVFPRERLILANGKREALENMAARVQTFQRELGERYPGIEVDVMNISDDEIGSSYKLVEESRVLTMDRMIIENVDGRWHVTDETGGADVYLRNARKKRFQLTPRTGRKKRPAFDEKGERTGGTIDGPFLSYESVLRFARAMAEFPGSEVDPASVEEVKAFVATGIDKEGRALSIRDMLDGFAKGDEKRLKRRMSPPIKSLLKAFIHAEDPGSVIDLFKSIGTEENNLYTIFSAVVDLDILPSIVRGAWAETGDMSVFDEAFFSRNRALRENPYVQRYTVDTLMDFLRGKIAPGDFPGSAEELAAMRRFMSTEHAGWLERTNGMDLGERGGRRSALVVVWSSIMLAENISFGLFLGLRHYVSQEFFDHVRTDFVNITGRIKAGEFRNLLDYYVKEYNVPSPAPIYAQAGVGDNWVGRGLEELRELFPGMDDVLGRLPPGAEVLMIGPGVGFEILDIQQAYPGLSIRSTGLETLFERDGLREMIQQRYDVDEGEADRMLAGLRENFVENDAETGLPYETGTFDAVITGNNVVQYINDKPLFIEETYRILKENGTGLIELTHLMVLRPGDDIPARLADRDMIKEQAEAVDFLNAACPGRLTAAIGGPRSPGSIFNYAAITLSKADMRPLNLPLALYDPAGRAHMTPSARDVYIATMPTEGERIHEPEAPDAGRTVAFEEDRRAFESDFIGASDEVLRFLAGRPDAAREDIVSYSRSERPVWRQQGRLTYEHRLSVMIGGAEESVVFYSKRYEPDRNFFQENLAAEARVAPVVSGNDLGARARLFTVNTAVPVLVSLRVRGDPMTDPDTMKEMELPGNPAEIAVQIAYTLGRLHGTGVVHGDLIYDLGGIPGLHKMHVYIDKDGTARFIDFGDATYDPSLSSEDFISVRDLEAADVIHALAHELGADEQVLRGEYERGRGSMERNDTPQIRGNVFAGLSKAEERRWRRRIDRNSDRVKGENRGEVKEAVRACRLMRDIVDEVSERPDYRGDIRRAVEKRGFSGEKLESAADALFRALTDPGSAVLTALTGPEEHFKWFNARVEGDEKYLLGHESAIAVNVVRHLRAWEKRTGGKGLLEEYVLHEALENVDMPGLTQEEKHRAIIGVTNMIFARRDFKSPRRTPLGLALRIFIEKAGFEKETEELKKGSAGADGFAAAYTALIDRTVERISGYIGMEGVITVIAMGSYARRATPYGTDVDMMLLAREKIHGAEKMANIFVAAAETVMGTTLDFPVYPVDPGRDTGTYCLTAGKLEKQYREYLDEFDMKYEEEDDFGWSAAYRDGYESAGADDYEYGAELDEDADDYGEEEEDVSAVKSRAEMLWEERRGMDEEERDEEKKTRSVAMTSSLDWRYVTGPGSRAEAGEEIEGVKLNVRMLLRLNDDIAREENLRYFRENFSQVFNLWDFDIKKGMAGIRTIDMIVWTLRVENGMSYWEWGKEDSFGELVSTLLTAPEAQVGEHEARALVEARDFMIRLRTAVNIAWERRGSEEGEKDILIEADAPKVAKLMGMTGEQMSLEIRRHRKNVQAIAGTFLDYETYRGADGKKREKMVLAVGDRQILTEEDLDLDPSGTGKGSRGVEGLPNDRYTAELRTAINTGNILPLDFDGVSVQPAQFFRHDTRGDIPAGEFNYKLDEESAAALEEGIRGLGIFDRALLSSVQIVFFEGIRDAHYSLSRPQIYINMDHIRNAAMLTRLIHHELQERRYVTVQMDLFDPDWGAKRGQQGIEDKINEFAEKRHNELLEEERGGPGWLISTARTLARLWNALPRVWELRKNGHRTSAICSRKIKMFPYQGSSVDMPNYVQAEALEREVAELARRHGFDRMRQITLNRVIHEMAYNVIEHGGGGAIGIKLLRENGKVTGIEFVGWDSGSGMRDPEAIRVYGEENLQQYEEGFGFRALTREADTVVIESMGMRWEKDGMNRFRREGNSDINSGTRITATVYKGGEKAVWVDGLGSFRGVMDGDSEAGEREVTIVGRIPEAEGKQQRIESMMSASIIDSSEGFNVAFIEGVKDADGNSKKFVLKHVVDGTILDRYPTVSSLRKNAERTLFARGLLEMLLREKFPERNITLPEIHVIKVVVDGREQSVIATEYVHEGRVTVLDSNQRIRDMSLHGDILDVYFGLLMYWQDPQYIAKGGELVPFDMETVLSPLYYPGGDHSYNAYADKMGFAGLDRDACMDAARRVRDFVRENREKIMALIEETGMADEGEVSFGGESYEPVSAERIMAFLERQAERITDNLEETLSAGQRPVADVPAVTAEAASGHEEVEITQFSVDPSGNTNISAVGRHPYYPNRSLEYRLIVRFQFPGGVMVKIGYSGFAVDEFFLVERPGGKVWQWTYQNYFAMEAKYPGVMSLFSKVPLTENGLAALADEVKRKRMEAAEYRAAFSREYPSVASQGGEVDRATLGNILEGLNLSPHTDRWKAAVYYMLSNMVSAEKITIEDMKSARFDTLEVDGVLCYEVVFPDVLWAEGREGEGERSLGGRLLGAVNTVRVGAAAETLTLGGTCAPVGDHYLSLRPEGEMKQHENLHQVFIVFAGDVREKRDNVAIPFFLLWELHARTSDNEEKGMSWSEISSAINADLSSREIAYNITDEYSREVRGKLTRIIALINALDAKFEGKFGGSMLRDIILIGTVSSGMMDSVIDMLELIADSPLGAMNTPSAERFFEAVSEGAAALKTGNMEFPDKVRSAESTMARLRELGSTQVEDEDATVDMPAVSLGAAAPGQGTGVPGDEIAPVSAGEAVGSVKEKEDEELMDVIRAADPATLAYKAAYLEMSGRRAHEMLGAVRQDVGRKTLIMSLTQEQMTEEKAKVKGIEAATKRAIRKKFVVDNIKVVYYLRGHTESFKEAVDLAAEDTAFREDDAAGMMAFVDRGIFDAADLDADGSAQAALDILAKHSKTMGVVKENMELSQRQDVTLHVVLGVGLVDYVRTGREDLLDGIKGLLSVMVENEDEIMALTPEEVLNKLLKGGLLLQMRKIDYTEIDEWKAAQDAVTQSL